MIRNKQVVIFSSKQKEILERRKRTLRAQLIAVAIVTVIGMIYLAVNNKSYEEIERYNQIEEERIERYELKQRLGL